MDLFLTPIRHAVSLLFEESSVSMDRDFIKGCFQCLEFCIGQLYVPGTEVFFPGSWIQGSGLHLDIYAASSSMRSGLWLQLFSLRIPQAVQAPAGLLRYFLCEAVERICGHRRCGKNQNLQSLFRKENHLLLGRTEQALCCVPCSMELPPLLRLALPWNKYSGSRKVGFLY